MVGCGGLMLCRDRDVVPAPVGIITSSATGSLKMTLPVQIVYAADVGKPKNLGWARRTLGKCKPKVGAGPLALADEMASDAKSGRPIAIGFECPLFLPIAD